MKKYFIGLGTLVLFFLGIMCFSYLNITNSSKEPVAYSRDPQEPFQEISKQEFTTLNSEKYELKEYEGNLAIFKSGIPAPIKITSTPVEGLPVKDQELLKKGIEASSEEELNMLLEDYCS